MGGIAGGDFGCGLAVVWGLVKVLGSGHGYRGVHVYYSVKKWKEVSGCFIANDLIVERLKWQNF